MDKEEFLEILRNQLRNIQGEDLTEILQDYDEHITIGIEEGREEGELIKSLGDPNEIAKQINADYHIKKAETTTSASNILRAVYASIGLGLFNVIFVLGPLLMILSFTLVLFIIPVVLGITGITLFGASLAAIVMPEYFQATTYNAVAEIGVLFISIGLTSLGLLILIGDYYVAKLIYELILKYLKFNLDIISGKEALK